MTAVPLVHKASINMNSTFTPSRALLTAEGLVLLYQCILHQLGSSRVQVAFLLGPLQGIIDARPQHNLQDERMQTSVISIEGGTATTVRALAMQHVRGIACMAACCWLARNAVLLERHQWYLTVVSPC